MSLNQEPSEIIASEGWDTAKTREVHERIKRLDDAHKQLFAHNWRIPHSVFNVACVYWPAETFAGVDWFVIHDSRDLGCWANGNRVIV